MIRFFRNWLPTMLTLAVVLYATLWPDPVGAEESMIFPGADKLIHAVMMGGLSSAVLFDRRRAGHKLTCGYIVIVAIVMVVFSALDEVLQSAMGLGRSLDVLDFLADVTGIAIASLTAPPVINRIFRKRKPLF